MINQREMMAVLERHRNNAVVVPTMMGSVPWLESSGLAVRDVPLGGAMGKASSFGLGVALAQPNTPVYVLDGDGSLEMNLGTLITIGDKGPENLYHFMLDNGVYAYTGGQPIPGSGRVSFAKLAKAAGYTAAFEFEDLEEFTIQIESVLNTKGPVFITIKIVPEILNEPPGRRVATGPSRPTRMAMQELKGSFRMGQDRAGEGQTGQPK